MPTVFVPNKQPYDYDAAWDYGDLVFCSEGEVNRKDLRTMQADLEWALRDAQPDDYIMLSGLPSMCCVACSIFAAKFKRLNLLLFERGEYVARSLTLDNA